MISDIGTSNTSKTKTMVWDKGAWVSFTANIAWQIKTLGPLIWIWYVFRLVLCGETASHILVIFLLLFREARDKNSICKPKVSLYGLRKTVEYFVTKLR
jgi:hypothetical protein